MRLPRPPPLHPPPTHLHLRCPPAHHPPTSPTTGLKPRPIRCVAVLGGGLMGSGIATALALAGVEVILKEVSQQFLDGGMARIKANVASRVSASGGGGRWGGEGEWGAWR